MKEYTPLLVIGIFAGLLFLGTLVWTEYLFPSLGERVGSKKNLSSRRPNTEFVSSHR